MKLFCMLLAASLSMAAAGLSDVKTVYLLPMSSGLDQHLAVSLTTGNVLQVVTDPGKADAIFTDTIGASFEDRLAELFAAASPKTTRPTPTPAHHAAAQPGKGRYFPGGSKVACGSVEHARGAKSAASDKIIIKKGNIMRECKVPENGGIVEKGRLIQSLEPLSQSIRIISIKRLIAKVIFRS